MENRQGTSDPALAPMYRALALAAVLLSCSLALAYALVAIISALFLYGVL